MKTREEVNAQMELDSQDWWCLACRQKCHVKQVDNGIGPYEYWGAKGVHHDYMLESRCCDSEVVDYELEPEDVG